MTLTARNLSLLLAATILLLIAGVVALFSFGSNFLRSAVIETNHAIVDADISSHNVTKLKQLEAELARKQPIVKRAAQIVSDSKQYRYQDQIIRDINAFAEQTGVRVLGINFDNQSAPAGPAANALPAIAGVTVISASVTLDNPVNYASFLKFLKAIEQNLTKMQVTGVNLTPDQENPRTVSNPSIGLDVYVRK